MKNTTIHIRNMCCQRCIEAVTAELTKSGLNVVSVKLGEASFETSKDIAQKNIESALNKRGFILIKDEEEILIESIKTAILDVIHHLSEMDGKGFSLSKCLEEKTKMPYRHLLEIFKKKKGITIQKYFILQKIEKVKDLVENSAMQFSEIADLMGYKSLQHLSSQFKNINRMTMQQYQKSQVKKRTFIDKI